MLAMETRDKRISSEAYSSIAFSGRLKKPQMTNAEIAAK